MPAQAPYRNPVALYALLISLIPFLSSLSMLALKAGVGPRTELYYFAQTGGALLLGLVVLGSALSVVAMSRAGGQRDLRIVAALALLVLSALFLALFLR